MTDIPTREQVQDADRVIHTLDFEGAACDICGEPVWMKDTFMLQSMDGVVRVWHRDHDE